MTKTINIPNHAWRPVHCGQCSLTNDQSLVLTSSVQSGLQLVRVASVDYAGMVDLTVHCRPLSPCTSSFYVNAWGGKHICSVSASGDCRFVADPCSIHILHDADGYLVINVKFLNEHPTLSIGLSSASGDAVFTGTGQQEWEVRSVNAIVSKPNAAPFESLTFLDVGARGGPAPSLLMYPNVALVLVEPDPLSAEELRGSGFTVIGDALSDVNELMPFYRTRHPGCSSCLLPNKRFLSHFKIAPLFEVLDQLTVRTCRYEDLFRSGIAPAFDALKIDAQGLEHQILEGMGALLSTCLTVEVETHFYEVYNGQRLVGDIVALLEGCGFYLAKLEPQWTFDHLLVEANAIFVKDYHTYTPEEPIASRLDFLTEFYNLVDHQEGRRLADRHRNGSDLAPGLFF